MRADSRNGKKIPPGKLNIDTDAQTGAKLEHFVLVLIQKKVMMMAMLMMMRMRMVMMMMIMTL